MNISSPTLLFSEHSPHIPVQLIIVQILHRLGLDVNLKILIGGVEVESSTAPVIIFLSRVCTKAVPLAGFTC